MDTKPPPLLVPAALTLFASLLVVALLPISNILHGLSWHDQQRVGQISVITLIALFAVSSIFVTQQFTPTEPRLRHTLAALAFAGAASSIAARQPVWAFTEFGIALGCLAMAWMVVVTREQLGGALDRLVLGTAFFTCTALCLRFFVSYASMLATGEGKADPWLLLDGFSNLRFYGQFISLSLPLLAAPLLMQGRLKRFAVPAAILLVLWWAIAITTGTRGTWLGMGTAVVWLMFAGAKGRQWATLNLMAALFGLIVCRFWLEWLPDWAGLPVANDPADRLTTSLSGREPLWQQAIEMILAKPLLGFGPMHYSDIANRIAAHPHQAWLQWASEWGVPSALVITWLVWKGARAVFRVMRERAASGAEADVLRVCLAGSIAASLTQSMVDGVLVMPYTETWLALLAGWLFALHPGNTSTSTTVPAAWRWGWAIALVAAAGLLVSIVARDLPRLDVREEAYAETFGGPFKPRFWRQGVIAEKP